MEFQVSALKLGHGLRFAVDRSATPQAVSQFGRRYDVAMAVADLSAEVLTELDAIEAAVPGSRAEFIGGRHVANRSLPIHGRAILLLAWHIEDEYLEAGQVVLSGVRVTHPQGVIVPDLIVLEDHWLEKPDPVPVGELLLAVEVLSPATEETDRVDKRQIFEAAGVDYWLGAQSKTVEVVEQYEYGGGRWLGE